LFYSTFPIQSQAPQGVWDYELKAVYLVGILDFDYFDGDAYTERIYLARERTKERYSNKLNYIFVVLPKFKKTLEELESNTDRWLFCLKNLFLLDSRPAEVKGEIFEKLFRSAEINRLTKREMKAYNKSVLEYSDVRDAVDCARQDGREEGFERGVAKGIERGKFDVAKNLLDLHIPIDKIVEATGFTPEQLFETM
jgi:predicted transposase/invertase (TIGR01784 family)